MISAASKNTSRSAPAETTAPGATVAAMLQPQAAPTPTTISVSITAVPRRAALHAAAKIGRPAYASTAVDATANAANAISAFQPSSSQRFACIAAKIPQPSTSASTVETGTPASASPAAASANDA